MPIRREPAVEVKQGEVVEAVKTETVTVDDIDVQTLVGSVQIVLYPGESFTKNKDGYRLKKISETTDFLKETIVWVSYRKRTFEKPIGAFKPKAAG